jgi:hypothetical protein
MPTTIEINLTEAAVGATLYDVYVSNCTGGGNILVANDITSSDFPIYVDLSSDEIGLPNVTCYEYIISADTGCICENVVGTVTPTPTPTNTVTPTKTATPTITSTITPTSSQPHVPCQCYEDIELLFSCPQTQFGSICPDAIKVNYTLCDQTSAQVNLNTGEPVVIPTCVILSSILISQATPPADGQLNVNLGSSICCGTPVTPTQTPTNTTTPTVTQTPNNTLTPTPTVTKTATPTKTPTVTPTKTVTPTVSSLGFTCFSAESKYNQFGGFIANAFSSVYGEPNDEEIHICDFLNCEDIESFKTTSNYINTNICFRSNDPRPTVAGDDSQIYVFSAGSYVPLTYGMLGQIQQYPSPSLNTMYFSLNDCIYQFVAGFVGNTNPVASTPMKALLINCCTGPASTTRDYSITNVQSSYWNFANFNDPSNPTITLTRGQTYRFHICAEGYRFAICEGRPGFLDGDGALPIVDPSVIASNNIDLGTITFTPNSDYGNLDLYYVAYSVNGTEITNYPTFPMYGFIDLQG